MNYPICTAAIAALALGAGCSDKGGQDTGGALGDTAVATADSGLVGDSGAIPTSLSGSLTLTSTLNGEPRCDVDVALHGTPYTGDCPNCDFAFEIEAEVTDDRSVEGCYPLPWMSLLDAGRYYGSVLAWSPLTHGRTDALLNGYGYIQYDIDEIEKYPGPYWVVLASAEDSENQASWSGDALDWSLSYSYRGYYTFAYSTSWFDQCALYDYGYEAFGGDYQGEGTVDCRGETVDVWTIDALSGDALSVTVDTVDPETAFDAYVYVTDRDAWTCMVGYADDSFDCTYPPPSFSCPSLSFAASRDSTYDIVVTSNGSCAGSEAGYRLTVDSPRDPALTLAHDDAPQYISGILEATIKGSATLSSDARTR